MVGGGRSARTQAQKREGGKQREVGGADSHIQWIGIRAVFFILLKEDPSSVSSDSGRRRTRPVGQPGTPVLEPVDEDHLDGAGDRNRGKRADHARELGADQDRDQHASGESCTVRP